MPATTPVLSIKRLVLVAALIGAGAAHAAGLSLVGGNVGGAIHSSAGANGQFDTISGSLSNLSGAGYLLGAGDGDAALALTPSGSLSHLWSASASLDTTLRPGGAQFQAGSGSVRQADADGQFDGAYESLGLVLDAELLITSTGEALGTPVRLDVSGSAESLWSSTGPALDVLPHFDLVLRDDMGNILGSWQGLATGSSQNFAFTAYSQVGATLSFSLSHASSLLADAATISAGLGHSLNATALLDGQMLVSAVPEPRHGALLLAGLGALGLLLRHTPSRR